MKILAGIDAIYYSVHDFDRARNLYTALFGAAPDVLVPSSFCEWTLPDGASFGLVKGEHFRPGSGILFHVADIQAAVTSMRALDVKFEDDGAVEESPVCYMAFAHDTEGNTFVLHQRK